MNRQYTSRRLAIVESLVKYLKGIDGTDPFCTDLEGRVEPRLYFWDEVQDFPSVHVNAGGESRVYQGASYKDRFMNLTIRCYVEAEDSVEALEGLLEDIETVLEDRSRLQYTDRNGDPQFTQQISIVSLDTDEGVLSPLGVGEIICTVRY